jgi:hypothetical protein
MTYTRPQIVLLGEALRLTKGQVKNATTMQDFRGALGETIYNTTAAYASDE